MIAQSGHRPGECFLQRFDDELFLVNCRRCGVGRGGGEDWSGDGDKIVLGVEGGLFGERGV